MPELQQCTVNYSRVPLELIRPPLWGGTDPFHVCYNIEVSARQFQLSLCLAILAVSAGTLRLNADVLTNICAVATALIDERHPVGGRFDLTGQISRIRSGSDGKTAATAIILSNEHGNTILHVGKERVDSGSLKTGDHIRVRGRIIKDHRDMNATVCDEITVLGHASVPPPVKVSSEEILSGKVNFQNIILQGTVTDAFRDDIDERFAILVVNDGVDGIIVPIDATSATEEDIQSYIGAKVSVNGFCDPQPQTSRRRSYRQLATDGTNSLLILKRADSNPYSAPDIGELAFERPSRILASGRHKVTGRVLAVWRGDTFLLKTACGDICRVRLTNRRPPRYGDFIEAVGFPETDLYRINLSRAIWRKTKPLEIALPVPEDVRAGDIVTSSANHLVYMITRYGTLVRISGTVCGIPDPKVGDGFLYIESDQQVLRVDTSAFPSALDGITPGCRINVTGLCILDTHGWNGGATIPRIDGVRIVIRHPGDIKMTAPAPWWTPARLFILIGLLFAAIILIVIWNTTQRSIARLRFADRTRLAIELHDSISQNLTSVSLQVDAARELLGANRAKALTRLNIASKTIDSCRNELKNCLCDLRNETLDTDDLNAAIGKVLKPCLADAGLHIRFNVPRNRLSDNVAHAVLCIVRELATNAVRHGGASSLRVAGVLAANELHFSVSDNGSGFDPENRPGVDEGHFGLEGIAERVRRLGGRFELSSRPESGTRAFIAISKPI